MPNPLVCPFCHRTEGLPRYGLLRRVRCPHCRRLITRREETRSLFHLLWGRAATQTPYQKGQWVRLQELLAL